MREISTGRHPISVFRLISGGKTSTHRLSRCDLELLKHQAPKRQILAPKLRMYAFTYNTSSRAERTLLTSPFYPIHDDTTSSTREANISPKRSEVLIATGMLLSYRRKEASGGSESSVGRVDYSHLRWFLMVVVSKHLQPFSRPRGPYDTAR